MGNGKVPASSRHCGQSGRLRVIHSPATHLNLMGYIQRHGTFRYTGESELVVNRPVGKTIVQVGNEKLLVLDPYKKTVARFNQAKRPVKLTLAGGGQIAIHPSAVAMIAEVK